MCVCVCMWGGGYIAGSVRYVCPVKSYSVPGSVSREECVCDSGFHSGSNSFILHRTLQHVSTKESCIIPVYHDRAMYIGNTSVKNKCTSAHKQSTWWMSALDSFARKMWIQIHTVLLLNIIESFLPAFGRWQAKGIWIVVQEVRSIFLSIVCSSVRLFLSVLQALSLLFPYVCMYVCMYVCIHVCIHVCLYVYIDVTCTHIFSWENR